MKTGSYNTLTVKRLKDQGAYLSDEAGQEVLLPARYVTPDMRPGNEVSVFVYTDSDDRPVATTQHPLATVGQVTWLTVKADGPIGAFMDWGLPKDLLVPFNEQHFRLHRGMKVPVYVFLDHASGRVTASARLERYLGNTPPDYTPGDRVKAVIIEKVDRGYRAAVDDKHWGLIYDNEIYTPLELGQVIEAYVKKVRDDGKIDLSTGDTSASHRKRDLTAAILDGLRENGGTLPLGDKSSPEDIAAAFSCSKRDFKQALGDLYRRRQIVIQPFCITLTGKGAASKS